MADAAEAKRETNSRKKIYSEKVCCHMSPHNQIGLGLKL